LATNVSCAVLKVVEARHSKVHVELTSSTTFTPWGAPILPHDDDAPIFIVRLIVLDQEALPTTTASSIVTTAIVGVGTKYGTDSVRGCTCHPDLFAIDASTKFFWVHGCILGWRYILTLVPRIQGPCITTLTTAVPVVSGMQTTPPVFGQILAVSGV
jgi:hypothetical protein